MEEPSYADLISAYDYASYADIKTLLNRCVRQSQKVWREDL